MRCGFEQPFGRKFGRPAAGFGRGGPRLIHLACERVGGGHTQGSSGATTTGVVRHMEFLDRGVEMPEAKFRIAQIKVPPAHMGLSRVACSTSDLACSKRPRSLSTQPSLT